MSLQHNQLKFSVLMSVYNKENPEWFEQALDSIIVKQTVTPNEVVIVCDGELTPSLNSVLTKYKTKFPNILKIFRKEHGGLGKALNFGLPKCTHKLIARADTDDICKPNRFEKQLEVFEKNPDIDLVGSWIDEFDGNINNIISVRKLPETHAEIYDFGKFRCPVNHPTVMFRREAMETVGGYQHFYLFEDYYLWVRMLVNGAIFYNIQESLLWFRSSLDMYKRRGGLKYAIVEAKLQLLFLKLGYTTLFHTLKNIVIRFSVRVLPNKARSFIYKKFLRR